MNFSLENVDLEYDNILTTNTLGCSSGYSLTQKPCT